MFSWRVLGAALALVAGAAGARAQTYPLAEAVKAGDCFRYQITMELAGELRIPKDGKVKPIKLAATATHTFPERTLAVGKAGLPEKVARAYEEAKAVITTGADRSERTLRPGRTLVVTQRHKGQPLAYSPAGALTRPEIDLTEGHFDTLCLAGVLPGKAVKVGETWKLPNAVAQALCHFEGLTEHKLEGKLEKVAGDYATFSVTGTAAGIELGAVVKVKVEASGSFDLRAKRVVSLAWKQADERGQGPASPETATATKVAVKRTPAECPKALSDVALISVPDGFEPKETLTAVEYVDAKGRFAVLHGRDWQLVAETGSHTVLRLMDRGEFVAQVTVAPWTKAKKGGHLSPEEFKKAMAETSGWRPEKELQAGEVPSGDGRWVYRLSVLGQLDDVAVLQNFYLVAAPTGEQVVLTFTLTPKQADKLGARDLAFAGSLEVPASKTDKETGRPGDKEKK